VTHCERLSERMPAVGNGQAAWSAEELAHLAQCADCAAEWRLVRAVAGLGAQPAIDPAAMSARVLTRLASAPREIPVVSLAARRRRWVWSLAAAAALLLAVQFVPTGRSDRGARPAGVLSELDDLASSELETVLAELSADETTGDQRLDDLSTDELEQVLQDWES